MLLRVHYSNSSWKGSTKQDGAQGCKLRYLSKLVSHFCAQNWVTLHLQSCNELAAKPLPPCLPVQPCIAKPSYIITSPCASSLLVETCCAHPPERLPVFSLRHIVAARGANRRSESSALKRPASALCHPMRSCTGHMRDAVLFSLVLFASVPGAASDAARTRDWRNLGSVLRVAAACELSMPRNVPDVSSAVQC